MRICANESGGLCSLKVSHTDNTEDTDEEPNSALLLKV